MSKRNNILLFIALLAFVMLCPYLIALGPGLEWLFPLTILGFALGYGGGYLFMMLGNLLTTIFLYALAYGLVIYPSLKVKNNQPLTPLIALKMLGISIMYLSILVVFFFILFYVF